jgi:glutathione peroxidase-family protein
LLHPALQDGKPVPLCQFRGKVLLVVTTSGHCGPTSQYDGLESNGTKVAAFGSVTTPEDRALLAKIDEFFE